MLYATCDGCRELLPVHNEDAIRFLEQKEVEQLRILTPEEGRTLSAPYTLYLCEECHYVITQALKTLRERSSEEEYEGKGAHNE